MDLSQHKITQEERTTLGVVALADRPEMPAQTLKECFDALTNKVADQFNATVDDMQHMEDDYNVWAAREQGRVDAESSRVTAEQGRVNAETARADAEAARAAAEPVRMSAESSRVTAEQGRAGAEAMRVQNEDARKTAEQGRVNAETARVDAEAARAAAEAARADFVTGSVATAKAEADRAKAEADRASAIVGGDYMTRTEVGAAVETHNSAGDAHADIRAEVAVKAPVSSPAFTGTPTTPTASPGDSSAQVANTEFVNRAIVSLIGAAPGALDTLGELAASLGNDPNFAATILNKVSALSTALPVSAEVSVPASGWALSGGVYQQTVACAVSKATMVGYPTIGLKKSTSTSTAALEKTAFALVETVDTQDGSLLIKCGTTKPVTNITLLFSGWVVPA